MQISPNQWNCLSLFNLPSWHALCQVHLLLQKALRTRHQRSAEVDLNFKRQFKRKQIHNHLQNRPDVTHPEEDQWQESPCQGESSENCPKHQILVPWTRQKVKRKIKLNHRCMSRTFRKPSKQFQPRTRKTLVLHRFALNSKGKTYQRW